MEPGTHLRLLCVIDSLAAGGAQRQLVNIARGMKERGHHVEVFAYHPADHFRTALDACGVRSTVEVRGPRLSFSTVLSLRRKIRKEGFDAVLAFLETPSVYAEMACIGLPAVTLVVSERSAVPGDAITPGRRVKSRLHRLARAVTVNSHAHREWLRSRFPFLEDRLVTIWNGVDTELFRPGGARRPTGTLRLLGIGRITPAKNLDTLAAALAACRRRGVRVTLDWVGESDDPRCHAEVLAVVESEGISDLWRWHGIRHDVPELMREYDALVLPSLWEGLPNVVCEALASGLPVLASAVGDNARLVQHGRSGLLFDPARSASIADAIQDFGSRSIEERTAFADHGRAFALRELALGACTAAYERLLLSLRAAEGVAPGALRAGSWACS